MTITTTFNFGDTMIIDGQEKEVKAVHLYISENGTCTERYFFGNGEWYTLKVRHQRRSK